MVEKSLVSRQEAKIRELESKLEFEKTQVKRLEVRFKDRWGSAAAAAAAAGLLGDEAPGCRRLGGWESESVLLWSEVRNGTEKGQHELNINGSAVFPALSSSVRV